jgi:MOSC domain-containing protein YiiM
VRILSVNVGLPREIEWQGEIVRTSIFKEPVAGRIAVRTLNLDGDRQSDLSVHGGTEKAVYAYPSEHYAAWRAELQSAPMPWGMFGENLTIEGLLETEVRIGDRLRAGSAELAVTQPRMPCFKLGARFGRPDMVKRFRDSGRSGFYLAVVREGDIAAGDALELVFRQANGVTIAEIATLYTAEAPGREALRRASELPGLSPGWQAHFRKRLAALDS